MKEPAVLRGLAELRAVQREGRPLLWGAAVFSLVCNLLMLTGPLYMMLVYDRVLPARSPETLVALTGLAAFLFLTMGVLDIFRGWLLSRLGAHVQSRLDGRVYDAALRRAAQKGDPLADSALPDLEAIRALLGSPVPAALFDLPWTPIFLAGIAVFHPWLGLLALAGGALLVGVAALNQRAGRGPQGAALLAQQAAQAQADRIRAEAGLVRAMGMGAAVRRRWHQDRDRALAAQLLASDRTSGFSALSRTLRLMLQSAMLGLGAFLALSGQMSAGSMIAGSVLLGRALMPVEVLVAQWPLLRRAARGRANLARLLGETPLPAPRTALPRPEARLEVQQASVLPPGAESPALRLLSFTLSPGQAIGVIGPSGAGKTTLARALTSAWPCAGGRIRLGGATLEQYPEEELGRLIGYLPQRVEIFDGTLAENIARLEAHPDPEKVVAAARKADAHEMILKMPQGYDTRVTARGGQLSGGQIQRIGLARAMYGDPVLLVLDEPNSNLDNEGSEALNRAIVGLKQAGGAVLIMAHRPAAIRECDLLLMLENGSRAAFGPRDEVLRKVVRNHDSILKSAGGVR
ncbi:type I secretion system permease/ATPase [Pseudooceanicola sp. CBS1P-1]|uniref:Type I secretion system permease/ATPase n=1 Tax=Pseudooceanicola albus TaxID=2692189 RepID=A0A6L7G8X2_9RHOB|nr:MULTISPECIES: type I secretion system permease/ATPase [Pseudooceanicola]MBT9384131.1 type I secretion system permease/ATPase [Pseudooceanicola endophyticus]MXN19770.1 type I secretion system permease/ATPase [Pseudooceanicola albus]